MGAKLAARLQTMRILWGALLMSVLVLDAVLVFLRTQGTGTQEAPPHLAPMLGVVAVATAAVSIFLPKRIFAQAIARMNVTVIDQPGELVGSFRETAPSQRVVAEPEEVVFAAFPAYQSPFILGMALAESIALDGFLVGFLDGSIVLAVPFLLFAFVLMTTHFPRISVMTSAIERVTKARCSIG